MKRFYTIVIAIIVLMSAALAYARPWDRGEETVLTAEQQRFFEETRELRKEMHEKRFELMELYRNPNSDKAAIDALEQEVNSLRAQIQAKAQELNVAMGCGQNGNCPNADNRIAGCGNCGMRSGQGYGMCGQNGGCGMRGR